MTESERMNQYVSALPAYIRENLEQSGVHPQSMEQLKQIVENMQKN